ncbi:MAG TPA: hypothetical protein VME22_22725 [Solirubrobacteraceae bacterium]|nr:hypothetical protein [Solirubrobacteraceae bacterium]
MGLRRYPAVVLVAALLGWAGLVTAPSAWAGTVNVNTLAHVAYIGETTSGFHWVGTVTDPALGNGALTATLRLVPGGYAGTATILNPSGSLTGAVRATFREQGQLVHFGLTADITAASGRFAGARGTLTGTALVTATLAIGTLRLHGTLHGASGRAPAPLGGPRVRRVDGHFLGAGLSLARDGVFTAVGSVTGLVPGPAVMVAHERATTTSAHGTLTLYAAGGTLTGVFNVRYPGGNQVRVETGTYTFSRGSGDLSGAHTTPLMVRGVRELQSERISTRMKGTFTL